jgi:hypothetical protein
MLLRGEAAAILLYKKCACSTTLQCDCHSGGPGALVPTVTVHVLAAFGAEFVR